MSILAQVLNGDQSGSEGKEPAIVIDMTGSQVIAGFSGDDAPSIVFPNVIATSNLSSGMAAGTEAEPFFGDAALAKASTCHLSYPVQHGQVIDWEAFTRVLKYAFDQLKVDPAERNVMIAESLRNSKENRERLAQILFEEFSVGGLYIAVDAIMVLYSAGRTTGLIVKIDGDVTHAVSIWEGYLSPSSIQRIDLGKQDLVNFLGELLKGKADYFSTITPTSIQIASKILDELGYVAADYEKEAGSFSNPATYELPDGIKIEIGSERLQAPEALFQPSMSMLSQFRETLSLPEMIYNAIAQSDVYTRRTLCGNIVLAGEGSLLPGLPERLKKELEQRAAIEWGGGSVEATPSEVDFCIIAPPERKYSAWIGGSMLSSLSMFENYWVTRSDYEENGFRSLDTAGM